MDYLSISLCIYLSINQYRWYEIITYNSKQTQLFSRTLEIGVERTIVLPTQLSDSDCHFLNSLLTS